jgi:hypothetical protein
VKPFFDTSTPATDSSTDSSTQNLDLQLTAINGIAGRERGKPTHNKDTTKVKLERLRSARLIRHDPDATKLDMQRLQKGNKESNILATITNHF